MNLILTKALFRAPHLVFFSANFRYFETLKQILYDLKKDTFPSQQFRLHVTLFLSKGRRALSPE